MEHELTQAIIDWQAGEKNAKDKFQLVIYDHLRSLAASEKNRMEAKFGRDSIRQSIQSTTALVHEAFIKIEQGSQEYLSNRKEFALLVAKTIHSILVDYARKNAAHKRDGKLTQLEDKASLLVAKNADDDRLLDLSEALLQMEREFPRQAQSMQLKYFGGLMVKEIADLFNISASSAEKDIAFAKSWLKTRLA